MQDIKYYVPSIEEFHVGFEFETCYLEKEWIKKKLLFDDFGFYTSTWEVDSTPETEFRVKILDKEDIESFGFVHDVERDYGGYKTCYTLVINPSIGVDRMGYTLDHLYTTNRVIINLHDGYYDGCIFDGVIRNKSELKKILRQVGVLNETN